MPSPAWGALYVQHPDDEGVRAHSRAARAWRRSLVLVGGSEMLEASTIYARLGLVRPSFAIRPSRSSASVEAFGGATAPTDPPIRGLEGRADVVDLQAPEGLAEGD